MLTPVETEALLLSLRVSSVATLAILPVGIAVAMLLARVSFPLKWLVDGLIHLPLVVPPVVVGYLLLIALGRQGPVGSVLHDWFGVTIAFTWQGAAMAAAVMAFPLLVRATRLSIEQVDRGLEDAARTLGASSIRVFATVTLPLVAPGILTGAILAFARALGEFGATITFVANIPGETQTLPLALYAHTQVPGEEWLAFRLAAISVVVALVALAASEILARRLGRVLRGDGGTA